MRITRLIAVELLMLALVAALAGGCIEMAELLSGIDWDDGGGGLPDTNDGPPPADGDENGRLPLVRLTVEPAVPQMGDEVTLTRSLTAGSNAGLSFAFGDLDGRLESVDTQRGTAVFIVEEADVWTEFTFTCIAANEAGTGPESEPVTVIPG